MLASTVGLSIPSNAVDRPSTANASQAAARTPPNIVLITTDDMRLSDLRVMPNTRRLIGGQGVTVGLGLASHPLCCPARAQLLTGQYAQNNGVRSNSGKRGGYGALEKKDETVAAWLTRQKYQTGFVGKFLNDFSARSRQPRGWTEWHPYVKAVYDGYGVGVRDKGANKRSIKFYRDQHSNEVVESYTLDMIDQFSKKTRGLLFTRPPKPFFIWSSYVAPHGACEGNRDGERNCSFAPDPARQDRNKFQGTPNDARSKRSYNEADVTDKPPIISDRPPTLVARKHDDMVNRRRLQSLVSVDRGVKATVDRLAAAGVLGNTLIIFTSDNGYLLGEHRYFGKNVPYEEALRVPLLIRGPGLPAGVTRPDLMAPLVDVTATIAAAAGVTERPRGPLDGRDLKPYLTGALATPDVTQLIQVGPLPKYGTSTWTMRGVRTSRFKFALWDRDGFVELYDLARDPFETENLAKDVRYRKLLLALFQRTRALEDCSGASCYRTFGPLPLIGTTP